MCVIDWWCWCVMCDDVVCEDESGDKWFWLYWLVGVLCGVWWFDVWGGVCEWDVWVGGVVCVFWWVWFGVWMMDENVVVWWGCVVFGCWGCWGGV